MLIVLSVVWKERPNATKYKEVIKSLEGILSRVQVMNAIQHLKEKDILKTYREGKFCLVKIKTFREPKTEQFLIEAGLI